MNQLIKNIFLLIICCLLFSCQNTEEKTSSSSKVKIVSNQGQYQLLVNDKPYEVRGVGLDFVTGNNFKALSETGGNTFRTWSTTHLEEELEFAKKYNLMVAVGLDLKKELHGFNYTDEAAVEEQFQRVKKIIDKYKGHPNILCWVVGNELNLLVGDKGELILVNPKAYQALAKMVDYIHEVDPDHPVTTTFAGITKSHIDLALKHCPNLDFLGLQTYGGLGNVEQEAKAAGITMPYMVTEFGPMGHWERPSTSWGREIEEPSAVKAAGMSERIEKGIKENKSGLLIGYFAFLWGQKQERTPTWYGMFNKSGEATARVDEMAKHWLGKYPENRAPLTDSIRLDGKAAVDNVFLEPQKKYQAEVYVREPNGDKIDYKWEILREVDERSEGGAFEKEPELIPVEVVVAKDGQLEFVAPEEEGDYRLFSYAYDGKGKVGNANIPFFVKKK